VSNAEQWHTKMQQLLTIRPERLNPAKETYSMAIKVKQHKGTWWVFI